MTSDYMRKSFLFLLSGLSCLLLGLTQMTYLKQLTLISSQSQPQDIGYYNLVLPLSSIKEGVFVFS